ncbi:sensor histidine kinase [Georgenia wangjunii]|uniref:sensor histidine kinase n=1 Tax=Georgenia wangjunii TaxID=3117730 RepID=UPI002F26C304
MAPRLDAPRHDADAPGAEDPPSAAPVPPTEPFTELSARRLGPLRRFLHHHPAVLDWVIVLWFAGPSTGVLLWDPSGLSSGERVTAAVLIVIASAVLLRRRHAPVLVLGGIVTLLAASLAATGDTSGLEIASVFALYAVAAYRRPTTAWLGLLALNVAHALSFYVWYDPVESIIVSGGGNGDVTVTELTTMQAFWISTATELVLSLFVLAIGTSARNRRHHVASLVERTSQLALERDQREQIALTAERNRIAREMHDVVAHSLSVMVALSDGAAAALARNPDTARHALEELSATGRSALTDTRRVLGVLREDHAPPALGPDGKVALSPQPAAPDLADLVARFQAAGLPVQLTESGPPLPADAGLQLAVYRIVQEALTNVLRHAPGSPRIEATLVRGDGQVDIEVYNEAGASAHGSPGGRGVIGMRERAAVYDGHVEAGPARAGWRVRAVLRWNEEDEA